MIPDPHPNVVKHIQRWQPRFIVQVNPAAVPGEYWDRYIICKPVPIVRDIGGGVFCTDVEHYSVLSIPQAMEVDYRWIPMMEESRWKSRRDFDQMMRERRWNEEQAYIDEVGDWARDEGWWHFKKDIGDKYNFTNADNTKPGQKYRDPYAKTMAHQDFLGRPLK